MSDMIHPDARSHPAGPEVFSRQGYMILPQLVERPVVDFLWSYVHTKFASLQLTSRDAQVKNTPADYGDATFDGLLEFVRPRIEGHAGMRLYPTYSYFRLYKHGDELKRHRDRPACEISVSLNIGQVPADPWPLHIKGDGEPFAALLSPGDGLLYRGCDRPHWRERFEGNRLAQVFLHYVDADGPHADHKFDKRLTLMRPKDGTSQADQAIES